MKARVEQVGKFHEIVDLSGTRFSYICKIHMWQTGCDYIWNHVPVLFVDIDDDMDLTYVSIPINRRASTGIDLFKSTWDYTNNKRFIKIIQDSVEDLFDKDITFEVDENWMVLYQNIK